MTNINVNAPLNAWEAGDLMHHNAYINGRRLAVIIDAGSQISVLSRGDANRVGLDYSSGEVKLSTIAGKIEGFRLNALIL